VPLHVGLLLHCVARPVNRDSREAVDQHSHERSVTKIARRRNKRRKGVALSKRQFLGVERLHNVLYATST
jgi:hypothetical protein